MKAVACAKVYFLSSRNHYDLIPRFLRTLEWVFLLRTKRFIILARLRSRTWRLNSLYEQAGSTVSDYVFVGKLLIAKLSGGSIYYFHQDTLGSTRLVTTGSTTSFSTNYQPFGPQYGASGTDPNYKYTGKPQDIGTGLYYYGARYYDGSTGRFISRDPSSVSLRDPSGWNPYLYVRDNPENSVDPTGKGTVPGSANDNIRAGITSAIFLTTAILIASAFFPASQFMTLTTLAALIVAVQFASSNLLIAAVAVATVSVELQVLASQAPWWLAWIPDLFNTLLTNAAVLALGPVALKAFSATGALGLTQGLGLTTLGFSIGFALIGYVVNKLLDYFGLLCDFGCNLTPDTSDSGGTSSVGGWGRGFTLRLRWTAIGDLGANSSKGGPVPI